MTAPANSHFHLNALSELVARKREKMDRARDAGSRRKASRLKFEVDALDYAIAVLRERKGQEDKRRADAHRANATFASVRGGELIHHAVKIPVLRPEAPAPEDDAVYNRAVFNETVNLTGKRVVRSSFVNCYLICDGVNDSLMQNGNIYMGCRFSGDAWPSYVRRSPRGTPFGVEGSVAS